MPGYSWGRLGSLSPDDRQRILDSDPTIAQQLKDLRDQWAAGVPESDLRDLEGQVAQSVENAAVSLQLAQPLPGSGGGGGAIFPITGNPRVGSTLTLQIASWESLQWMRDGTDPIPGATDNKYVVQQADVGHYIGCQIVTDSDNGFFVSAFDADETFSLWSGVVPPPSPLGIGNFNDGRPITQGTRFFVTEPNITARAVRFFLPADAPRVAGGHPAGRTLVGIYEAGGLLVGSGSRDPGAALPNGDVWIDVPLDADVPLIDHTDYIVAAYSPTGNYSAATGNNYFTDDVTSGPLVAPASATGRTNGVFVEGTVGEEPTLQFPNQTFNAGCYFIDVMVATGA
jgi:hypothetical protein